MRSLKKKKNINSNSRKTMQRRNGLKGYADQLKIPSSFLRSQVLIREKKDGKLEIPYLDENGQEINTLLCKDNYFTWKLKSNKLLYGLWKLQDAKEKGKVILAASESECHVLWYNDFQAIGLPEPGNWKEEDAHYFEGIDKIYTFINSGLKGDAFKERLQYSSIRDRVYVIELDSYKSLATMYTGKPKKFKTRFRKLLNSSIRLTDYLADKNKNERDELWERCEGIASNKNILDLFIETLSKMSIAGEEKIAKAVYLALTTRLFDKPVSIINRGESSLGKSYVPNEVLKFFPTEAYYPLTSASENALIYSDESFRHRFIFIGERAGINSSFLDYIIRELISAGRLCYEVTGKRNGQYYAEKIIKEGPTGFITTTTKLKTNDENETRYLSFEPDDTPDQTRKVMITQSEKDEDDPDKSSNNQVDLSEWQAFQEWLGYGDHQVAIHFGVTLAKMIDPSSVRMRRDITKIRSLIKAHAIIHQVNRNIDSKGRIIAKIKDYAAVCKIVSDSIAISVGKTVPNHIRETVMKVKAIKDRHPSKSVSITKLSKLLGLHKSTVQRRVEYAVDKGYLVNLERKAGVPAKIVLGEPLPDDRSVLPTPMELWNEYSRSRKVKK